MQMKATMMFVAGWMACTVAQAAVNKPVMRCGWFDNPTPGNAWLYDRDGEWTISTQGGHEADGDWPPFKRGDWVETNGPHGHGCACLKLIADPQTREVQRILSAKVRPKAACRAEPGLKEPT
jgi:hypothetical protein